MKKCEVCFTYFLLLLSAFSSCAEPEPYPFSKYKLEECPGELTHRCQKLCRLRYEYRMAYEFESTVKAFATRRYLEECL